MRCLTFALLFALCLVSTASSQKANQQKARRAVVVPAEDILLVIAYQPDCPLKFEKVSIVKFVEARYGEGAELYQIRNCGPKPIRAYTIATFISSSGGASTNTYEVWKTGELLMPGQTPRNSDDDKIEIVPLTEELRTKLRLHEPMQAVEVFMIVRVEFADGHHLQQ